MSITIMQLRNYPFLRLNPNTASDRIYTHSTGSWCVQLLTLLSGDKMSASMCMRCGFFFPVKSLISVHNTLRHRSLTQHRRSSTICCLSPTSKSYSITLLPGDGIGPEVVSVAKEALSVAGSMEGISFSFFLSLFRFHRDFFCNDLDENWSLFILKESTSDFKRL